MSNELNGPVGSPVGLVSGTGTMSVPGHPPAVVVPHTGQFLVLPQPLRITNNAVTRILSRILVLIQSPRDFLRTSSQPAQLLKLCVNPSSAIHTRAERIRI